MAKATILELVSLSTMALLVRLSRLAGKRATVLFVLAVASTAHKEPL
jgi:hypothetical protein